MAAWAAWISKSSLSHQNSEKGVAQAAPFFVWDVPLREEYLVPLGLSARTLVKALDVPANRLTEIRRGSRDQRNTDIGALAKIFIRHQWWPMTTVPDPNPVRRWLHSCGNGPQGAGHLGPKCRQSESASEWNVPTLVIEDRRGSSSARIRHLIKDRTHNDRAFRGIRWEGLKDHVVEMILVSVKGAAKVVVPCRVVQIADEMDSSVHDIEQADEYCIRGLHANSGKVLQIPCCLVDEFVVEPRDDRRSGGSPRHRRVHSFNDPVSVYL